MPRPRAGAGKDTGAIERFIATDVPKWVLETGGMLMEFRKVEVEGKVKTGMLRCVALEKEEGTARLPVVLLCAGKTGLTPEAIKADVKAGTGTEKSAGRLSSLPVAVTRWLAYAATAAAAASTAATAASRGGRVPSEEEEAEAGKDIMIGVEGEVLLATREVDADTAA